VNKIRSITEVNNLGQVASDLDMLLSISANSDIKAEFPETVTRYTADGNIDVVEANLRASALECVPGVRQQFITFAGGQAVGMSVVRLVDNPPIGIDPFWPNVSVLICNPYRGNGLGGLAMSTNRTTIAEQFHGNAWTRVKKTNTPSKRMVIRAGFVPLREDDRHIFYTYRSP
jgi:hypothetical protein